jgi:hypothetical protein
VKGSSGTKVVEGHRLRNWSTKDLEAYRQTLDDQVYDFDGRTEEERWRLEDQRNLVEEELLRRPPVSISEAAAPRVKIVPA